MLQNILHIHVHSSYSTAGTVSPLLHRLPHGQVILALCEDCTTTVFSAGGLDCKQTNKQSEAVEQDQLSGAVYTENVQATNAHSLGTRLAHGTSTTQVAQLEVIYTKVAHMV